MLIATDTPLVTLLFSHNPSGENAIVLFGGANQELSEKDIFTSLVMR